MGDEVYASKPANGLKDGNNLTFGRMTVFDVADIEQPKIVAWYEPTDGGVHNIWVAGTRCTSATTRAAPGRWTSPAS